MIWRRLAKCIRGSIGSVQPGNEFTRNNDNMRIFEETSRKFKAQDEITWMTWQKILLSRHCSEYCNGLTKWWLCMLTVDEASACKIQNSGRLSVPGPCPFQLVRSSCQSCGLTTAIDASWQEQDKLTRHRGSNPPSRQNVLNSHAHHHKYSAIRDRTHMHRIGNIFFFQKSIYSGNECLVRVKIPQVVSSA